MTNAETEEKLPNEDFSIFLENNPASSLTCADTEDERAPEGRQCAISQPWGDPSVEVLIPLDVDERRELSDALSDLYLPKRFSAVVHRKDSLMEVIWTAYELKPSIKDVAEREFTFHFEGVDRLCRFGDASQALLVLAKNTIPKTQPTDTDHRNIVSLHFFAKKIDIRRLSRPVSFFIDISGLVPDGVVSLAKHINAYVKYFDRIAPTILIHEEESREPFPSRQRFIRGEFPERIHCRSVDENILSYWNEMNNTSNNIMRYLLCYRILEYASFNYIEPQVRAEIKRLISRPDAMSNLDTLVGAIYESSLISSQVDEINRMQNLLSYSVDMSLLWDQVQKCRIFFNNDTTFDGGFVIKRLVTKEETFVNWQNNAVRNLMDRFRLIRNALAHGQDQKTRLTIRPSAENSRLIGPWLNLIETSAAETVLYRNVV